jgi:cysteine desulfurase/selenocysteine lyase
MNDPSRPDQRRIYLDNAATSWPKSTAALEAAIDFTRQCGATAGRGTYRSGLLADRWLTDARTHLSRLLKSDGADSVAICNSGTHALNAALWGLLRGGEHVITSGMDHNSLLRPLKNLETQLDLRLSIVPSDSQGYVDPAQAESLIDNRPTWLAIGHASNVTGRVQDIDAWSTLAQRHGARLLVDASQTLGYIPIDLQRTHIDALAAAGHKGLRALAGTGLLVLRQELRAQLRPLMHGGTGLASEQLGETQPWPQTVEVGNLNLPGVVSLAVAAAEVEQNLDRQRAVWQARLGELVAGLREIDGLRLVGWDDATSPDQRIPVLSLQLADWDCNDLANVLDSFGIEARAGWHCAALVHAALGTAQAGGTLRLSPGVSTTAEEIEYVISVFQQIAG